MVLIFGGVLSIVFIGCYNIAFCVAILIIGLSASTAQNEHFNLHPFGDYLQPQLDNAWINILTGIISCLTALHGCIDIVFFRKSPELRKREKYALIIIFGWLVSMGIATLVICNDKGDVIRQLSVLTCTNAMTKEYGTVLIKVASNPLFRNVLHCNSSVCGYLCSYDLMTPCGILLLFNAFIYIFLLLVDLFSRVKPEVIKEETEITSTAPSVIADNTEMLKAVPVEGNI